MSESEYRKIDRALLVDETNLWGLETLGGEWFTRNGVLVNKGGLHLPFAYDHIGIPGYRFSMVVRMPRYSERHHFSSISSGKLAIGESPIQIYEARIWDFGAREMVFLAAVAGESSFWDDFASEGSFSRKPVFTLNRREGGKVFYNAQDIKSNFDGSQQEMPPFLLEVDFKELDVRVYEST